MIFTALRSSVRTGIKRTSAHHTVRNATSGPGIPSGALSSWYNMFGKSNAGYITWIVAGVLVGEGITGFGINTMWASVNKGRTYDTVDWSKFVVEDDDDDDEEDEDDDEGGDDEDGEEGEKEDEEEDDDDDE
eukprot:scaffold116_cov235-Chaetoceros_neogracile.AAC.1